MAPSDPGARRSRGFSAGALALLAAACAPEPAPERVRIAVPYQIATLDPHAKNAVSEFAVVSHFYEPLVTTDADMRLGPGLARQWENPDPLSWVFQLRPDVRFHGGKPLRAGDVVYSIRRLLDSARSEGPPLEMAGYVVYISEVEALDPLTVLIRTERALSVLLNKLRFVAIVPEGATRESLAEKPDGTGPWRLGEWRRGERLRLVRNEAYWGERPALAEAELLLETTPLEAAEALVAGRVQLAQLSSRAAAERVERTGRFAVARRPSLFLKYLSYDLANETTPFVPLPRNPFRDRRVREAIHLALDRERIAAALPSVAVPATQPVPPLIFGHNPRLTLPQPDLGRARALLAEAGLPGGFELTLHTRTLFADAARLVAGQLAELGLRARLVELDDPEFLTLSRQQAFSCFVSRIGAPTGDASDVLENALHSPDAARNLGISNVAGYANPELDRLIEESAGIDPLHLRRAALEHIMQRVMDDLAWIPLYVDQDVYALDPAYAWQPRNDGFVLATEVRPAPR